jgi:hypothetical protein
VYISNHVVVISGFNKAPVIQEFPLCMQNAMTAYLQSSACSKFISFDAAFVMQWNIAFQINLGINGTCLLHSVLSIRSNRYKQSFRMSAKTMNVIGITDMKRSYSVLLYALRHDVFQPLYMSARISFWHAALKARRTTHFSNKRPGTLQRPL